MWRRPRHRVAPLGRRALARAIDGAIVGVPLIGYHAYLAQAKRWTGDSSPSVPAQVNRILELVSFAASVVVERGRTPGFRIVGLRRLDGRTGAEIGLSRAIARVAVMKIPGSLTKRLTRRHRAESREQATRMEALLPELSALQSEHANDPESLDEAVASLYQKHGVERSSCQLALAPVALGLALAVFTRRLLDRLTGKPIVVER